MRFMPFFSGMKCMVCRSDSKSMQAVGFSSVSFVLYFYRGQKSRFLPGRRKETKNVVGRLCAFSLRSGSCQLSVTCRAFLCNLSL